MFSNQRNTMIGILGWVTSNTGDGQWHSVTSSTIGYSIHNLLPNTAVTDLTITLVQDKGFIHICCGVTVGTARRHSEHIMIDI